MAFINAFETELASTSRQSCHKVGGTYRPLRQVIPFGQPEPKDLENQADRLELIAYLIKHAGLTPREEECLLAHFLEGLTQQEIGERIGHPRQRVGQIIWDAIQKMRVAAISAAGLTGVPRYGRVEVKQKNRGDEVPQKDGK